jgi:hypothetical protein
MIGFAAGEANCALMRRADPENYPAELRSCAEHLARAARVKPLVERETDGSTKFVSPEGIMSSRAAALDS